MAIRDEQGLERHVFSQTGVAVGTVYNGAHSIDTTKVVRIHAFAKGTVNGSYAENHNPSSGQINGLTATSDYNAWLDTTNWNISTAGGATNLVGGTINIIVYTKL